MTKPQRLHREKDPRVRRSVALALGGALLLVAGALAVVGPRIQAVRLGYRVDALRVERAQIVALIRELAVEQATLRSPGRIESRARQLGLTAPTSQQVRLAREYVVGGSGISAAHQARLEAAVR